MAKKSFPDLNKDGKVTHKTSGDNLVKVGKDDKEPSGSGDKDVDDINKSLAKARGDKKNKDVKRNIK